MALNVADVQVALEEAIAPSFAMSVACRRALLSRTNAIASQGGLEEAAAFSALAATLWFALAMEPAMMGLRAPDSANV